MRGDAKVRECHSGGCVIVPATRRLLRDGVQVELEAKVFDPILLLVDHHARAPGKQENHRGVVGAPPDYRRGARPVDLQGASRLRR